MRLSLKREIPSLIVLTIMFLIALLLWNKLPDSIPVHWDIHGEVDRYGSRFEALLLMPIISSFLYLLLIIIPFADQEKMRVEKNRNAYDLVRLFTLILMLAIQILINVQTVNPEINAFSYFVPVLGLFYIALSPLTKKLPTSNFNIITDKDGEEAVNKLNELTSKLFMLIGLIMLPSIFFPLSFAFILFIALNIFMVIYLIVYSFRIKENTIQ